MVPDPHPSARFEGIRWKAVRLGLRLANSRWGPGVLVLFYALWGVIGVILSVVLIPMALQGSLKTFENALNPVALYGFVWPMALMAAATWTAQLVARILWCGLPAPLTATALAPISVAGRLAVLGAAGSLWFSGGSFASGLQRPGTLACAGIAGLGLAADWGFLRILRRRFLPAPDPTHPTQATNPAVNDSADAPGNESGSMLTRDLGAGFKRRFPRGHNAVVWIVMPLAGIASAALSSAGEDGLLPALLDTVLRLASIIPVALQIFGFPGTGVDGLISALSPRTPPFNRDPSS